MAVPTRMADLADATDLISAVCDLGGGGLGGGGETTTRNMLGEFVGMDDRLCGAYSRMSADVKDACQHTFKHANSDELDTEKATVCMNALFEMGDLAEGSNKLSFDSVSEMLQCVTATEPCALDKSVNLNCRAFFAPPMLLSRNENYETCVTAETEAERRRKERIAKEENPVREIVKLLETTEPEGVDSAVTQIMNVCSWDKASPQDRDALNRMLSIFMRESPATVRRICNSGNLGCERMERKEDICSAIQKSIGTNAYLSKIYDYYAQGEMTGLRSVRLTDADRFPAPYDKIFDEVLLACRLNTPDKQTANTQTNVMHALIRTPNDVSNRNLCARLEGSDSVLPQMTREMAQTISTMASR